MTISIQDIAQHATKMVRAQRTENFIRKHGNNTIVLFITGNYLIAYEACAIVLGEILKRHPLKENGITTIEFNTRETDIIFPRVIKRGYKIAILER